MNGPVFVAGIIERELGFASNHSLVGHQNIVSVVAYSPLMFLKDPKKPLTDGSNVVALFAMAARSSISIWLSSSASPIVVLEDVFDRDILDLQWSKDSKQLWASSSEGHVGVFSFELSEFGPDANVAPEGAKEQFHADKWKFQKPARRVPLTSTQVNTPTQPFQPTAQKTTIMANGKKRIQPSLLSTVTTAPPPSNGFVTGNSSQSIVFPGTTSAPSPAKSRTLNLVPSGASAVFATASGSNPFTNAPIASTSKGKERMPSRAPSPSQMRLPRKPASISLDDGPLFASSAAARDSLPPNLDTDLAMRPPKHNRSIRGATLGQNREREKIVIDEVAPAFIPDEGASGSRELKLAVPAAKTYLKVTLQEAEAEEETETNCLEIRNFKTADRATEVAHIAKNGSEPERTMWVDYLENKIVNATWNGVFGAVSTSEGGLTVYSVAGRRCGLNMIENFLLIASFAQTHASRLLGRTLLLH
jgi:protein HIRA/HIR1